MVVITIEMAIEMVGINVFSEHDGLMDMPRGQGATSWPRNRQKRNPDRSKGLVGLLQTFKEHVWISGEATRNW
jgi:hypothetical protein